MLFHLFSVVKVLYILISGRYEKQNVKTGQIQKRGKDRILQWDYFLTGIDIDQFRIFLCKIKFLKHPQNFLRQVQYRRKDRVLCAVFKGAADQLLLDQDLQLVQNVLLDLFS